MVFLLSMYSFKMETVTTQTATDGADCLSQTNWIQLTTSLLSNMRQIAHVSGQQRPDGQLENKNLMEAHFIQHPMYPSVLDMRRPLSHKLSAFTPPISGSDISQGTWNLDNLLFKCIFKIECCWGNVNEYFPDISKKILRMMHKLHVLIFWTCVLCSNACL